MFHSDVPSRNCPGGKSMRKHNFWLENLRALAAVCTVWIVVGALGFARIACAAPQFGANKGAVVGIAFDGRMVSDLDKSVEFYKFLGFSEVPGVDKSWHVDEVMNRLHGTPGAESRMAKLAVNTNISGKPFTLYLHEFRGIKRRNVMGGKTAWEPGASHIDLTVPDAGKLWADLKAANMLWPRSWGGELIALPGATKGTVAYITDPDGMDVEIIEQRPATPATDTRPATPADVPGFNHIGLVILDPDKARAFYGVMLGGQRPRTSSCWLR